MARIFMDGWEHGNATQLWDYNWTGGGAASVVSASGQGMTGNYCLYLGNVLYVNVGKNLPSTYSEMYFSVLARSTDTGEQTCDLMSFYSGGTCLTTIGDSIGFPCVTVGGTIVAYGPIPVVSHISVHHWSGYFKLADSGGRWVVYIDGVLAIDYTGDTKYSTQTTFDRVYLGQGPSNSRNFTHFDDFVLDTTTLPLRPKVISLMPSGAGSSTQWSTSVSTPNWECVNESPPSDTDYVYTDTINLVDTYNLSDLPSDAAQINAVQVGGRAKRKETSGIPAGINLVLRTNSTNYDSSDQRLTLSFKNYTELWNTNPSSTGVAWDVTAINSLQAGIKSIT
jgi:hypothetical protein